MFDVGRWTFDVPCSAQPRGAHGRGGFTLLEVLLALAIATVLLAGLLMALGAYAQHVRGGQRRVELGALGRAVLTDIECDLRALVRPGDRSSLAPVREPTKPRGGGVGDRRSADAEQAPSRVLFGDAEGLILRVNAASATSYAGRPGHPADAAKVPPKTKLVAHYLLRDDQIASPALQKAVPNALPRRIGARGAAGLLRAEALAPPSEMADPSRALADVPWTCAGDLDQVVGLRFRYFDGHGWHDHWDNALQHALPVAVEIEVSLVERPEAENARWAAATLVQSYRLVVKLPVADEYTLVRRPGVGP